LEVDVARPVLAPDVVAAVLARFGRGPVALDHRQSLLSRHKQTSTLRLLKSGSIEFGLAMS
jgi:hypothetical protein